MANHKSSLKRIRSNDAKRLRNRYQAKTVRNAMKAFLEIPEKKDALAKLPKMSSMLDRIAKTHIIHKNKAANLKSELALHVNKMK
jgi:small subunit ribosomal protein S20